jgi:hypothetical protein
MELLGTQSIQEVLLCDCLHSIFFCILSLAGIVAYSLMYHFLFCWKGGWPLLDDGIIFQHAFVAASLRALRTFVDAIVIKHSRRKLNGE